MEQQEIIITFFSTHQAIKFEKTAKINSIEARLSPVPRMISSSCGLAGRFKEENLHDILTMCKKHHIEFESIYRLKSGKKSPERINLYDNQ